MTPANFPERKRQRQITVLGLPRLARMANDAPEKAALLLAVAKGNQRSVRTKRQLATGSADRRARHAGKLGRNR